MDVFQTKWDEREVSLSLQLTESQKEMTSSLTTLAEERLQSLSDSRSNVDTQGQGNEDPIDEEITPDIVTGPEPKITIPLRTLPHAMHSVTS